MIRPEYNWQCDHQQHQSTSGCPLQRIIKYTVTWPLNLCVLKNLAPKCKNKILIKYIEKITNILSWQDILAQLSQELINRVDN